MIEMTVGGPEAPRFTSKTPISDKRFVFIELALLLFEGFPMLRPYARVLRVLLHALGDDTIVDDIRDVKRDLRRIEEREFTRLRNHFRKKS